MFKLPKTDINLSFETILQVTLYPTIIPLGFLGGDQVKLSCEYEILASSTFSERPGTE